MRWRKPAAEHRLPVVLDCDPGHDDAVAILVALAHCEVRAITTVAGNAALADTTRNALACVQVSGADVPVHPGADRPLISTARRAPEIHGEYGLEGVTLPSPLTHQARQPSATEILVRTARETEGLWVVATGPLTNVALALRADPDFGRRIAGISLMGGGIGFGNVTAAAEFNIWADPEAAKIVFDSGVALVQSPLDVTHQLLAGAAYAERVRALDTPCATFMAELFTVFAERYGEVSDEPMGPLHDPCAVFTLTHPELFEFDDLHVAVDVGRGACRGMTIADRRSLKLRPAPNVRVATRIDADAALDLIYEAISSSGR